MDQRCCEVGNGEIAVIGEEVPQLYVLGQVKHDHAAEGGLPFVGGRGMLGAETFR